MTIRTPIGIFYNVESARAALRGEQMRVDFERQRIERENRDIDTVNHYIREHNQLVDQVKSLQASYRQQIESAEAALKNMREDGNSRIGAAQAGTADLEQRVLDGEKYLKSQVEAFNLLRDKIKPPLQILEILAVKAAAERALALLERENQELARENQGLKEGCALLIHK